MIQPARTVDGVTGSAGETVPQTPRSLLGGAQTQLRAAIAMLTRVPLGHVGATGAGVPAFPIVGAMLGLATFIPLTTLGGVMPAVAAILAVATLAVLSGGLHLDGLADTFDALVAVGPDAAERARRDPAIGVAGATALAVVLALDVAALTSLIAFPGAPFAVVTCVVAGALSRLTPVLTAAMAARAATDAGLGAWFVHTTRPRDVAVAVATALLVVVACSLLIGSPALAFGGAIAGLGSLAASLWLVRRRGQLDGDLLGASVETTFVATVVAVAALAGWPAL